MNPEQLLKMAAEAIKNRPAAATTHWLICYFKGMVHCKPRNITPAPDYIFLIITDSEAREGLTPADWGHLATKMTTFFKEAK